MSWLEALAQRPVWTRACKLGLPVGILQAVINQGEFWLNHRVDTAVITKTIISPLITFTVALASAAAMYLERQKNNHGKKI